MEDNQISSIPGYSFKYVCLFRYRLEIIVHNLCRIFNSNFSKFKNLKMLYLAKNNINQIQFGDLISNLPSLRFLGLIGNKLSVTVMAELHQYRIQTDLSTSVEFEKSLYQRPIWPSFCQKTRTIKLNKMSWVYLFDIIFDAKNLNIFLFLNDTTVKSKLAFTAFFRITELRAVIRCK